VYDLLLKSGTVVDGLGEPRYRADLAVKNGQIAKVGEINEKEAEKILNCKGKFVTPGFIDFHSHSDSRVLMDLNAWNTLEQGITTEIAGQCGYSIAPLLPPNLSAVGLKMPEEKYERLLREGGGVNAVFAAIAEQKLPTNMAFYMGQGSIRRSVMGYENRKPTRSEMDRMKACLREGMETGCLGMSSGLIYPPGSYTEPAELEELCKVVAEYGGSYTSHMRNEGNRVVESVRETLEVGKKCGIPVVLSHHKVAGKHNKGKSKETLALVDEAIASGREVYIDLYPYDGANTSLLSSIPPRYSSEGIETLMTKLKQKDFRAEVREMLTRDSDEFENLIYSSTPEGVIVFNVANAPEFNGKTLAEIAKMRNRDVYEALFDIVCEDRMASAIYRMICVEDMENIMKHPMTMGGVDGGHAAETTEKSPFIHPRNVATFPRIIGTFCRDKGLFPLEECVRKLCALPARAAGLSKKGILAEGKDADIVVFDFETIDGGRLWQRRYSEYGDRIRSCQRRHRCGKRLLHEETRGKIFEKRNALILGQQDTIKQQKFIGNWKGEKYYEKNFIASACRRRCWGFLLLLLDPGGRR
jgi:N-acyl-D-amino-acid deacylase